MAKVYFDNYLLPEIPSELKPYGPYYCIKANSSDQVQIWACKGTIYVQYVDGATRITQLAGSISYMVLAADGESWENLRTGNWYSDTKEVLWSSHDMPNFNSQTQIVRVAGNAPAEFGGWKCAETTGGTSLSLSVNVNEGDWILATVTTRSATTFPDGWTVLRESSILTSNTQRMAILCKKSDHDGVESFAIRQSSSARIYINLCVFKSVNGFLYHNGSELFSDVAQKTVTTRRPNYGTVMWCCSAHTWKVNAPFGDWGCDNLTPISLDQSSTAPRQANFYDDVATSSRTFVISPLASTGSVYIIDYVEVLLHTTRYSTEGTAEFSVPLSQISELSSSEISWNENTPDATNVLVEARASGSWRVCTNGGAIPCLTAGEDYSDSELQIRVTLTTSDTSKTPTFEHLRITILDVQDANVIRLIFTPGSKNSIRNAVGQIIVAYDSAIGTLAGAGGKVMNFNNAFAPSDLLAKPDVADLEHISVSSEINANLIHITFHDTAENEHVGIAPELTATLTHIDDL